MNSNEEKDNVNGTDITVPDIHAISVSETYQMIDIDTNTFETIIDGKPTTVIGKDYGNQLVTIEKFTEECIASDDPPFTFEKNKFGKMIVKTLPLGNYYPLMKVFLEELSSDRKYSALVELFIRSYQDLELELEYSNFRMAPSYPSFRPGKKMLDLFIELVNLIRKEGRKSEFNRMIDARAYNSSRNYESAVEYSDGLFAHYARLEVIRIDFGYKQEHAQLITAEAVKADLEHFLNNRRGNKRLFAAWVGYIYKIEAGAEKGCHIHLILFFDGSKVHKDSYLANEIGKYWQEITDGRGIFYNCNASKNKYKRLGIGTINHTDVEKRANLLYAIKYLTKKEQYLRSTKAGSTCRVFGKGVLPKTKNAAGRPRKKAL